MAKNYLLNKKGLVIKMEPVISPTLIYLIHMINAIYGLSIFILFVSAFTMVMSPLIADCATEDFEEEGESDAQDY